MRKPKGPDKHWDKKEIAILEEWYGKIPHRDLLLKLPGRDYNSLTNKGKTSNLMKHRIDYKLNISSDIAYFLGWVASDGNLYHGKTCYEICIAIHPSDKLILERLRLIVGMGEITECSKSGILPNGKLGINNLSRYRIFNKALYEQIKELGITENKSKSIQWICLEDKYYRDFIRGVFDGDGCISFSKPNKNSGQINGSWKSIFYSASKPFLEGLHSTLKRLGAVTGGSINYRAVEAVYRLNLSKKDTISLGKWFYYDECTKLDRKYDRFQKAFNKIAGGEKYVK